MQVTFDNALATLGSNSSFRLINGARTPANYLFQQILPERNMTTYEVKSGSMTIRALMAGLVGMDSPYPEASAIETSTFLERSAKIALAVRFPEAALRVLQDMVMRLQISGGNAVQAVVQEVLNFQQKLLIQPHWDTAEWLRGQALLGSIDWTFNGKNLAVDYGIPTANILATRTGTAAYGGTASAFWSDVRAANKLLRYNRRAIIMHSDTFDVIIANAANNITVLAQSPTSATIQMNVVDAAGNRLPSSDARDRVDIVLYSLEGEVLDLANANATIRIPFIKPGKVLFLGNNTGTGYQVGAGSQVPQDYELGYTHIAPTVEGGGAAGRWARVYTPEGQPWSLVGEAVANELPVIEAPEKIVVATTDMP